MSDIGSEPGSAARDREPGPAAESNAISEDGPAEPERLRAEAAEHHTPADGKARRRHLSWRTPVSIVLIVLGCILGPVAVIGSWASLEVSRPTGTWPPWSR